MKDSQLSVITARQILISLAFLPSLSFSAPIVSGVSGTYNDISTITITGSGFGSHGDFNGTSHSIPDHLATVWKDYEDNTLESDRMIISFGFTHQWSINTDAANRSGSSYYGYRFYVDDSRGGQTHIQQSAETTGTHWTSFWMQVPNQSNQCGSKYYRHYWGPNSGRDNSWLATGEGYFAVRGFSECGASCSPSPTLIYNSPNHFQDDTWHRMDIYLDRNGEMTTYMDMKRQWTRRTNCGALTSECVSQEWIESSIYSPGGNTIQVAHSMDSAAECVAEFGGSWSDMEMFVDDIFINYTRARVELCNKSTWADVTDGTGDERCEVQIPRGWSDISLDITTNTGAFTSGQTAYLYVVTENSITEAMDVNANGFSVTIGESGGGPDPDPEPGASTSGGYLKGYRSN